MAGSLRVVIEGLYTSRLQLRTMFKVGHYVEDTNCALNSNFRSYHTISRIALVTSEDL